MEGSSSDFDPMMMDYMCDIGLGEGDNPMMASVGQVFKERRTQDVPCVFHDGFSGTCWKGAKCVYGHEKYTGGVFAKKYPELAFAAGVSRSVTAVFRLAPKPILNNEREMLCRVTHVISPGEFFIRPINPEPEGAQCACHGFDNFVKHAAMLKLEDKKDEEAKDPMEGYEYGFTCNELPEGLCAGSEGPSTNTFVSSKMEAKLQATLNNALFYKKLQRTSYVKKLELVAARVQGRWMRAIVLNSPEVEEDEQKEIFIRVQLLETGEKLAVSWKEVCQLPEQFCGQPAAAFRCSIFRVSPVWFHWVKSAIKFFKELVENRDITVIVKDRGEGEGTVTTFEEEPYTVKILIDEKGDGVWTDVTQQLIDRGFGLEWNLMPFRPFSRQLVKSEDLDFLHTPEQPKLPTGAVSRENMRLVWETEDQGTGRGKTDGGFLGNGSIDSEVDILLAEDRKKNNERIEKWNKECDKVSVKNEPGEDVLDSRDGVKDVESQKGLVVGLNDPPPIQKKKTF